MRVIQICILIIFLYTTSGVAAQQAYVTKVIDGDSLKVKLVDGRAVQFRLYGIDSPEYNQRNSSYAKNYLKKKIYKRKIQYTVITKDRYGRFIVMVKKDGKNINEELVRLGYTWVYPRYCKQKICDKWENLERRARSAKYGLWKEKDPISPWDWKHK